MTIHVILYQTQILDVNWAPIAVLDHHQHKILDSVSCANFVVLHWSIRHIPLLKYEKEQATSKGRWPQNDNSDNGVNYGYWPLTNQLNDKNFF